MAKAALLSATVLAANVTATEARADENDVLFGAVEDLCMKGSETVDGVAKRALKMPYDAFNYGSDTSGHYARQIGLRKLGSGGTVLILSAPSKQKPMAECRFVSYADDMASLARRFRTSFDLPEPAAQSFDVSVVTRGEKTVSGRSMKFVLQYGLQDNQRSGAFTLTVSR
jgi:hypothetical protein